MRNHIRVLLVLLAAVGGVGLVGAVAVAQDGAAGVINYRQAVMSAQGGHMSAIAHVVRGEAPEFSGDIAAHARALDDLAAMVVPAFPEGSLEGAETDALPAIWEDWDDFTASAESLQAATAAFVEAAESGDASAIGAAFGEVGQGCGTCHDRFRAE